MDPKPQKPSGWLRLLLIVSLGLNLLIIGAVVGAIASGGGPRGADRGMRAAETTIGVYGRALEKSQRREVGRAIRAGGRGEGRALRGELRELAEQAVTVLRADPFVAEDFESILTRQQVLIKSRVEHAQGALSDYVSRMTPQERAAYADRLVEVMSRGPSRKPPGRD